MTPLQYWFEGVDRSSRGGVLVWRLGPGPCLGCICGERGRESTVRSSLAPILLLLGGSGFRARKSGTGLGDLRRTGLAGGCVLRSICPAGPGLRTRGRCGGFAFAVRA